MFCNQCEETKMGKACVGGGVCGKDRELDLLQDLLIYTLQGLGKVATEARKFGIENDRVNRFTCEALFSTLTNVNFDKKRMIEYIYESVRLCDALKRELRNTGSTVRFTGPADFSPEKTLAGLVEQAEEIEPRPDRARDQDTLSCKFMILYGLKGVASYAHHAQELGKEDPSIYAFIHEALARLLEGGVMLDKWLELALRVGEVNLRTMELLDAAHVDAYGHPEPTQVSLGHRKGKAILVSGHDLKALEELLKQTEGKGINIYTHGEMLPAHGYPGLKKYSHLAGHYGTSWPHQRKEFSSFPGPVLITTNCIIPPGSEYRERLFTMGPVGYPGVKHVKGYDFSQVIDAALEMDGFSEDEEGKTVTVGFARSAVLSVSDKVVGAVKEGLIKHFFLVGGCDGRKSIRKYYTEFVEKLPKDTVIITLGCGKFRFFDRDLGKIGDIPRLLDVGQCNDAYSAIKIAEALSKALSDGDINRLPLSLNVSWYEQKAVAILLTLLYLGVKSIRLGPTLPAFLSPALLEILKEKYDIKTISTPERDIKEDLG